MERAGWCLEEDAEEEEEQEDEEEEKEEYQREEEEEEDQREEGTPLGLSDIPTLSSLAPAAYLWSSITGVRRCRWRPT